MESRRATTLLLALTFANACSLATSLDGLTGGADSRLNSNDAGEGPGTGPGPASSSGGTGPASSPPADAASPAPTVPSVPVADAASPTMDATAPPMDAASIPPVLTWCQRLSPQPLFCADFDTGSLLRGWGSTKTQSGGAVALDTSFFNSPPGSLFVTAPAVTGNGVDIGELEASFTQTFKQATYSFDLFTGSWPSGTAQVAAISLAGGYAVRLDLYQGGGEFHEDIGGSLVFTTFNGTVATGQWTRAAIVLVLPDASGSGGSVTLSFDGVVKIDHHPVTTSLASGAPNIELGGTWVTGAPSGWTGHFDDVTFDLQ